MSKAQLPDTQIQKAKVPAGHPFVNKKNHETLLKYIMDRINFADQTRQRLIPRMTAIDKDVAAFLMLSDDDKKRRQEQLQGKGAKAVPMHIPLVMLHLDDALTYFVNVFAPESGMFHGVGKKDEIDTVNAFAELMNQHAAERGYFTAILRFVLDALKYNLGGVATEWRQVQGNSITNDEARSPQIEQDVLWEGNDLRALDMYNTLWDPSVHPIDVHSHGEYVTEVEPITAFKLRRMVQDSELFNVETLIENPTEQSEHQFFEPPPELFDSGSVSSSASLSDGTNLNWINILSEGRFSQLGTGIELTHTYIHLIPKQFGLIGKKTPNRDRLEIWRITIANGKYIANTEHISNAHGRLPFNFSAPQKDGLGLSQKSVAEVLAPMQNFGSFLMNTHVAASRKNIWDLIVYDPTVVDLNILDNEDVAGRVPVKPTGYGKDLNKAIWQNSNRLDTTETMTQLKTLIELMQLMWPTQAQPQQIASMDRAVENQVASVVQSTNRRLQKAAKVIDEQALKHSRFMMHWNVLEFQQAIEIFDQQGNTIQIDPAKFRDTKIRFLIGDGLRTLDKATVIQQMQRMVNNIIQNQAAAQEFDIPALLDFMSTFMDVQMDLTQFRRQQPTTPPQGQEGAGPPPEGGTPAV